MKVLHLNITEKYGGAAIAANRLHTELIKQGINSKMLVLKRQTKDPNVIEVSSLYSFRDKSILLFRKISNRIIRLFKSTSYFDGSSMLFGTLDKLDFDILHLHWVTEGFVNFNEFKHSKLNIIWTMHDCAAFTGICHVIGDCSNFIGECGKCPQINSVDKGDISNKEYLRKSNIYNKLKIQFVSPSKWLALTASKSTLLKDSIINIIPHGINIEVFSPIDKNIAKQALQINPNVKILLCGAVTFKDENKGLSLFSQALVYFRKYYLEDEKIELLFFGECLNEERFSDFKTKYLGCLSDELLLRICYSAADVVVVPSKQESFGLIAQEALACGTPVVAFGATGLLDIIDNKVNGYLAEPYKSEDLALGIKWCLDNNKDLTLSRNARNKAVSSFNINSITQKYLELYSNILTKK